MKIQLINGVIHIYGTPTYSDCGKILVQIYDIEGYVLKDFILNIIKQDFGQEQESKQEQNQQFFKKEIDMDFIYSNINTIQKQLEAQKLNNMNEI